MLKNPVFFFFFLSTFMITHMEKSTPALISSVKLSVCIEIYLEAVLNYLQAVVEGRGWSLNKFHI